MIEHAFCLYNKMKPIYTPEEIYWSGLSFNPGAIYFLEQNLDKVNWYYLSCNPAAIHLLEQNPDKIHWDQLSKNPAAIHLLEQNPDKIDWRKLSANPAAIHLLERNLDNIDWTRLSENPAAIQLLEQNQDKIDWNWLSGNPSAMKLLDQNPDRIYYPYFSRNSAAYDILENNPDVIDWSQLVYNPNPKIVSLFIKYRKLHIYMCQLCIHPSAIRLVEEHLDNVSFINLSQNPNALHLLFPLDHKRMKEENAPFAEELCAKVFEPARMIRLAKEMPLWEYMDSY